MVMAEKQFYSPQDVADMFGLRRLTIYEWIKKGQIEAFKVGKHIMIPKDGFERFLEQRRYEATAETTDSGVRIFPDKPDEDLYAGRGWGDDETDEEEEMIND